MVREDTVLGHIVSQKGIDIDKENIQVIEKLPPPIFVMYIPNFMGHAVVNRRFIKDF